MAVMTALQPANADTSDGRAPTPSVARLRAREREATDAMIRRYAPTIRRLVARLSGWSPDVDDLVQDVFASALMSLPKFRGDADLETWLTRIAIHRVRRWQRRQVLMRLWKKSVVPQVEEAAEYGGAEDELIRRRLVRSAIAALPATYREVITLRYLEERSANETAVLLGIRVNTVDVRAHRGRALLAERLRVHEEFETLRAL